ncbi:cysteine-rich receptor-like protein kinase 42 [Malania oleifera]|uniref:cysteine-rich receptor-like protein kinase 42 n=1 Tax=Malania oleifera TaxID=397392 RepID=UPI0025AE3CC1|nr:cysteine-rich receptor-like protein kinase 42 [Malania oleifera]
MARLSVNHPHPIWAVFFSTLCFLLPLCFSDPRISEANLYCGQSRARGNSTFITGFVQEMEQLSQHINNQRWGTGFVNSTPPIYGLVQCYRDLSQTDCLLCYSAIRTKIPRCLPATSAWIYLDGCFLRYENYSFFGESVDPVRDTVNCTSTVGSNVAESAQQGFSDGVARAIDNVTKTAVANGGFGVAEVAGGAETVYAMAQCWSSVSREGCRACLEKAGNESKGCLPSREGRGLNAGCYLRYSTTKFFGNDEAVAGGSGNISTGVIVGIISVAATVLCLTLCVAYAAYLRLSKKERERRNLIRTSTARNKSSLNFKYETLEKATNYFDPSRKLGQGGAGSVYMGILSDGTTVAVKRLVFNTRQWVDEFFNEVNLVGGIEHKNLVKLLGCSIEGPESLLVYEYLPNRSVDQFISDKGRPQNLNWKQRFNIILGTAEGLAYLHGGSQIRIIHRDIKSSNILLDENLNAKIADFGLARCFAADKTHLSTGIAGTLGYMAPEYLVRGQLTEKADVYGFGVLVLEIVCGRKNNLLVQGSSSLLQTVWKLYKLNRLPEAVDPCLEGDFPVKEVSNVMQIALLCAQALPTLRPSMVDIVQMLTEEDHEIPVPNQPPFLNASVLDSMGSIKYSSTSSSVSTAPTKIKVCCTSTESSGMQSSSGTSRSTD